MLAIGARPELLDRRDQAGSAVGHDQARRGESATDQITTELEPADDQRLERVGPQQPLAVPLREQLRDERVNRLADLRDLDPQHTLHGLQMPRTEPVALPRRSIRLALVASPPQPLVELVLDRPLDAQPGTEPGAL